MVIEHVFAQVVGQTAPLREVFGGQLIEHRETSEHAHALLAMVPVPLIGTGAFWNRITGLWRDK